MWDYSILSQDSKQPKDFQGGILVPFAVESALSGVGKSVLPEQKLWYHKKLKFR